MDLKPFFNLRFQTNIAGHPFIAEVDCDFVTEVRETCRAMYHQVPQVDLIAARIGFDLGKPNGGCYLPDETSEGILNTVMKSLNIGAEHFMNERLGSYDNINNTITAADLGIVFPDGAIRLVWREEESKLDFDTSYALLKCLVETLLRMQEMPYFNETPAEYEDGETTGMQTRRSTVLFEMGLWPADDDTFDFEGINEPRREEILARFANLTHPEAEPETA